MNEAGNNLSNEFSERLGTSGFRFTPQRRHVYDVLLHKRDHPTADEVFVRAKKQMPDISHATVYNCLDALVKCGLARQVQLERGATRFCPNMTEHGHFHCSACGTIYDVNLQHELPCAAVPRGFKVQGYDVTIHGLCADCAARQKQ